MGVGDHQLHGQPVWGPTRVLQGSGKPMRSAVSAEQCPIVVVMSSRDMPSYRRRIPGDIMVRSLRLLAVLASGVALATATSAAAAIAIPPPTTTIEDQKHRRPPTEGQVGEAWHSRDAVQLFRSGERNFVPDPDIIGAPVNPPQARPAPAGPVPVVPRPGVTVVTSLLLGLVGGVVGGCAALAGWIAVTRRRVRRPASAT
jgi:hypothetical protein